MLNLVNSQDSFAALPEEKQKQHRAKIGIRVRAFLDYFYVETRDAAVMSVDVELWANALQQFKHSEIMDAFGEYFDTGPRAKSGKLAKPDPGAIKAIIIGRGGTVDVTYTTCHKCKTKQIVEKSKPSFCYKCEVLLVVT